MGLSIYYSGRFKKNASLSDMIDEVKDIAEIHEWNYHIFETEFDPTDLGNDTHNHNFWHQFSPLDCEPVDITFLSNGNNELMQVGLGNR